jgi:hypothetical protein
MINPDIPDDPGLSPDEPSEPASVAKDKAQAPLNQSKQYVRDNPMPSVLAAFVVGLLIGLLLGRHESGSPARKNGVRNWWDTCADSIPSSKDVSKVLASKEASLRRGADKLRKKLYP